MGQRAAAAVSQRQRVPGDSVGLDIDAAARGLHGRQPKEQHVELRPWRHHTAGGAGLDRQAHLQQLGVDLFEQSLVTRNRLGVAGMAFHPADDLGAVREQLVRDVGVDQRRHRHVDGLDDVELAVELKRELLAPVALHRRQLGPAAAAKALAHADRGVAVGAVPVAAGGSHRLAGLHRRGGRELIGRGDRLPTRGVEEVLGLQRQVAVGGASGRAVDIGLVGHTFAKYARHQLDDVAGGHADRDRVKVQHLVLVALRRVQALRQQLGGVQCLAQAIGSDRALARDHDRQQLQLGVVVDPGFELRVRADQDPVEAVDRAAVGDIDDIDWRHHVHQHAVGAGTHVTAQAGLGEQVDVTHGVHRRAVVQEDPVVLVDDRAGLGQAQAPEGDQRHVGLGFQVELVADAVAALAGVELDIGAQQLGVAETDFVEAVQVRESIGLGARDQANRQDVGGRDHRRVCAGAQLEVAAVVAQRGAVDLDVRHGVGALLGQRIVDRKAADAVDPNLVDQV